MDKVSRECGVVVATLTQGPLRIAEVVFEEVRDRWDELGPGPAILYLVRDREGGREAMGVLRDVRADEGPVETLTRILADWAGDEAEKPPEPVADIVELAWGDYDA